VLEVVVSMIATTFTIFPVAEIAADDGDAYSDAIETSSEVTSRPPERQPRPGGLRYDVVVGIRGKHAGKSRPAWNIVASTLQLETACGLATLRTRV